MSKSYKRRRVAIFEAPPQIVEGTLPLARSLPSPPPSLSKKGRKGIAPFRTSDIVWERVSGFKSVMGNLTKKCEKFYLPRRPGRRAKLTIRDVGDLGFPSAFQAETDCGGWNMEQIELEAKLPPSSTHASALPPLLTVVVVEGDEGQGRGDQCVKFGQPFATQTE